MLYFNVLVTVAARPKVWVCGRSLAGTLVSNTVVGMLCVVQVEVCA